MRAFTLLLALLLLPFVSLAEESAEIEDRVRALDEEAQQRFEEGDFSGAVALLEASQTLLPATSRLFNLARCQAELGNVEQAVSLFERYLTAEDATNEGRQRAQERLLALRGGDRGAEPDPGADPSPQRSHRLGRAPFFSLLGVTLGSAVAFAVLGGLALGLEEDHLALCAEGGGDEDLRQRGEALAVAADVTLGLTAALAVTTVVLALFTNWRSLAAVALTPSVSPGRLSIALARSF